MNTLIFGFIIVVSVVFASIEGSFSTYIQFRSIAIVFGGSLGILVLSNPASTLKTLFSALGGLFKKEQNFEGCEEIFKQLVRNKAEPISSEGAHPLILYASELWSQGVDPELFIVLLSQKRSDLVSRGISAVQAMRGLAKYPPALGMTGTVMGIVNVFYSLDSKKDTIGMSLSTAMTATFLGLILANLLIAPLSDRLYIRQVDHERLCENLYELLLLINRGEPAVLIQGEWNERAA